MQNITNGFTVSLRGRLLFVLIFAIVGTTIATAQSSGTFTRTSDMTARLGTTKGNPGFFGGISTHSSRRTP